VNRGKSASQKTTKATPHIHEVKMPKIDVALQRGAKAVSRNLVESNTPFRVAMAQIRSNPADISGNTERIIGALYNAKASGANVVVFPEEAVSSYMSLDLRFYKSYVQQNLDGLERIRRATKDLPGLTAVVGFTDARLNQKHSGDRPKLWNSAAIIQDGKIEAVQDKSLHPNYNIFWDDRYFCPSRGSKIVKTNGRNIGVTICEDIWTDGYSSSPSNTLVKQGADLLLNLSASPWHIGKVPVREEVIRKVVNTHKVPMLYTNLVGCYDGYEGEVIFDGRSMFMTSRGQLGAMGKGFAEDLVIVDVNSQQRFTIPEIDDIEDLHNALVMGIRDYYHRLASKIGLNNAVIGLSGGIDSAIVAYLATEALGPDRIIGLTLPSSYSSEETQKDASDLANNLGISFFKSRSIESSFRTILKELNKM
jgi:NAD+ synthase (glutamine-hydrolysing)